MFITFNTPKQAMNFIKRRYKSELAKLEYMVADRPIYRIDIDKKKQIIEVSGWQCGCGCGKSSVTAKVIGKLKK